MKRISPVAIIAALIMSAFGAAAAHADIYMKQKVHTGAYAVMGKSQPEADAITVLWLGANVARTDQGEDKSTIVLIDKGIIFAIDHKAQSYSETPLDFSKQAEGTDAQASGALKGMMGSMSAKVTETAETKKIGAWNCRKYLIEYTMAFGTTSSEAWATTDIKIDYNLFFTASNAMLASQPGFENIVKEMKKIKGVIVYQVSTAKVMGSEVTTTTETLECSDKKPPAGTYEVPKGYKKVAGIQG